MWKFTIINGYIEEDGKRYGAGYSGKGEGKNNPAMCAVHNVGPLPPNLYSWPAKFECSTRLVEGQECVDCHGVGVHKHGPDVLRLTPQDPGAMFGRDGMLCHGDNGHGTASEGCPCFDHGIRVLMMTSADRRMVVVTGLDTA